MNSTLFTFFLLFSTIQCACNYTNTWIILENIDDSATLPVKDYQNDTFCVSTQDFPNGVVLYSNSILSNPDEASYIEQVNFQTFDIEPISCTTTNPSVKGCISHCQDKKLEATVVQAAISSSEPKDIVQQISKTTDPSTVVISAYMSPSDDTQFASYTYWDDVNFCSVFVKVKNNLQFPYAIMTTVQRVV